MSLTEENELHSLYLQRAHTSLKQRGSTISKLIFRMSL
jgi:hypothetical protein